MAWERLTEEKDYRMKGAFYRNDPGRSLPHELALASQAVAAHSHKFSLSTAELDALATKSAKVRALALIARECLALMRLRMEQDAGLGRDRVMERACDVLEATLAKFEQYDDHAGQRVPGRRSPTAYW